MKGIHSKHQQHESVYQVLYNVSIQIHHQNNSTVALEVACHSSRVMCHSSGSHFSSSHVSRITPGNFAATHAKYIDAFTIAPRLLPTTLVGWYVGMTRI